MRPQETILRRLGKALHVRLDDITHEPLPKRWVKLIHYLNEQERTREGLERAQPKGRKRPH
jgi:hypothetical protein